MTLDVATVLRATRAQVVRLEPDGTLTESNLSTSDLVRSFSGVSIDSRATHEDQLFVALPGERTDGHDFLDAALAAGARGALLTRLPDISSTPSSPCYLFLVPNALSALQELATYWRSRMPARVIGITGSIGKTTTKDVMASVLATCLPVLSSEANLNTEIGLPLMLL
jgi:UDP-N-acetylmuramoyl-tripeptide--D-alanyl-D-alanine ligase